MQGACKMDVAHINLVAFNYNNWIVYLKMVV